MVAPLIGALLYEAYGHRKSCDIISFNFLVISILLTFFYMGF